MSACTRCGKEIGSLPACPFCGSGVRRATAGKSRRKQRRPSQRPHQTAPTSSASLGGLRHMDTQADYRAILEAIDAHPEGLTRRELSQLTVPHVEYETVCGRIDELTGKNGRGPFVKHPVLAELPTTRKNKDTGIHARVLVRAERLTEIARPLL